MTRKIRIIGLEPQELELAGTMPLSQKGEPLGVATLGPDRKIPADQLPEIANFPSLEELGGEPAGAEVRAKAYTDEKISALPAPPTLSSLGGEPGGAEARAKAYADEKILALPAPPTLSSLGGEPVGAEARAKAYADEKISALPAPPTLSSLGGEPVGAETRAKAYADQKISAIPMPTAAQVGAIALSSRGQALGVASLNQNAKVPATELPDEIFSRLAALEKDVAALKAAPTPSPSPTPSPTGTEVYTHWFSTGTTGWLWGGSVNLVQDSGGQVARLGGNYSELYKNPSSSPLNLVAGSYRLICNCRLEAATNLYRIYFGTHDKFAAISNTVYADISLDFTLSADTNGVRFGTFCNGSTTLALFVKSMRILRL